MKKAIIYTLAFVAIQALLPFLIQEILGLFKVSVSPTDAKMMIINLTAVVLSALGILSPVTGALWHNCGSVFVVVNAALLLRLKDE